MNSIARTLAWLWLAMAAGVRAQTLPLPPRPADAPSGGELVGRLAPLSLDEREKEIHAQLAAGNVPTFLRKLCPVTVSDAGQGGTNRAIFWVTPDYLALGSDDDYVLMPMTPATAQRLADSLGCALPTRKMVDDIHAAADVRLDPSPIPPGPAMTTVPVFAEHNATVRAQRAAFLGASPLGKLVAGHKKDVVITPRLAATPGKVAIYGWHRTNGAPIQPLYLGHTVNWVDYSQCIRLVAQSVDLNGQPATLAQVLAAPELAALFSNEGVIPSPRYEIHPTPAATAAKPPTQPRDTSIPGLADFRPSPGFAERTLDFTLDRGVHVHVNAPDRMQSAKTSGVLLIFYALPNGNTTAQTVGKVLNTGDDWHYDIQHIGAQTRWLRRALPDRAVVVAYLENSLKSWPAWRREHGDTPIPGILDSVKRLFHAYPARVVLTGHSGGGSLSFGYLNTVETIPGDIERIAFLDSNYAYETDRHAAKLLQWLGGSDRRYLSVLAYNDAAALLDGKPFVSEKGGTWGRSHAMLEDLAKSIGFGRTDRDGLQRHDALEGRVAFLLKENPDRKILHTVQVERNGFIHAMLSGTALEGNDYEYFGPRAYGEFIARD